LLHDQLDILSLQPGLINLLAVVILLLLLGLDSLRSLALTLGAVVVTGVVVTSSLSVGELSSGGLLGLRVQVLDLSLTKDATQIVSLQSLQYLE
jgi:hypothetical protein